MLKKYFLLLALIPAQLFGQQQQLAFPQNLVTDNIPAPTAEMASRVKAYNESRSAVVMSWHPVNKEMLIGTRFGNTQQIHCLQMPMGNRKQLSFFEEAAKDASYEPVNGSFFIFSKDNGGDEFTQLFRYDLADKKITQLTEGGRTQNGNVVWNKTGRRLLYTATSAKTGNRNVYLLNPLQPSQRREWISNEGGGWSIADWSDDEKGILLNQSFSINETCIWLYDSVTTKKTKILPKQPERTIYTALQFDNTNGNIYLLTNKNSEFTYPALFNINKGSIEPLISNPAGETSSYAINKNQSMAAFVVNESGVSKMFLQDLNSKKISPIKLPIGVAGSPVWHNNNEQFAFHLSTFQSPNDIFVYDVQKASLTRWTESEIGTMNLSGLKAPELIEWKSFDQQRISGFLYRAASHFTGKRPVIISIHGGPEGQSLPVFQGRNNYYLNEMGISIIYPNVRGSVGYGKTFADMDNGLKRKESVQDIGSLLDWIALQTDLDANRVMITGGSYGGYMTLACAVDYSNRIHCALDVVGISNFKTFLQNTESYRRDLRRVEYGDERDTTIAAFFDRISPGLHADKITVPLMIVQGKNDPRVPYTESTAMANTIKERKQSPVWFMMANDEGHGFSKKINQDFQFYATISFIEQFLLK